MMSNRAQRRSIFLGIIASGLLVAAMTSGCSEKKESNATPKTPANGQPERRVTTGADPDKAPAYPGMYGAPAGSK